MIGERIKELREKNGYTQTTLAKKFNLSRSAINAWEMGVSVPSTQYLIELSDLFKVTTDYLLGLDKAEKIDISFLTRKEKEMIYSMIDYFSKLHSAIDLMDENRIDYSDIGLAVIPKYKLKDANEKRRKEKDL